MYKAISNIVNHVKSRLVVGALILLPLVIMLWVVKSAVGIADGIAKPIILRIPLVPDYIADAPGIGMALTIILAYVIGLVSVYTVGKNLIQFIQKILHKLPLYTTVKKMVETLFESGESGTEEIKPVVIVEYPSQGIESLGLAMSESVINGIPKVLVYFATTPMPNSGTLAFFSKDRVRKATVSNEGGEYARMTKSEYMLFIISMGTNSPSTIKTY